MSYNLQLNVRLQRSIIGDDESYTERSGGSSGKGGGFFKKNILHCFVPKLRELDSTDVDFGFPGEEVFEGNLWTLGCSFSQVLGSSG